MKDEISPRRFLLFQMPFLILYFAATMFLIYYVLSRILDMPQSGALLLVLISVTYGLIGMAVGFCRRWKRFQRGSDQPVEEDTGRKRSLPSLFVALLFSTIVSMVAQIYAVGGLLGGRSSIVVVCCGALALVSLFYMAVILYQISKRLFPV